MGNRLLCRRLAAVSGLRIPSHTSSFSFRGKNVTLEGVAAALKVRHVLECDVFGDDSHIRIGARLIDAESGSTLWSESFNRARNRLLEVQGEVAQAMEFLLEAREREDVELLFLDAACFDGMRNDPRFVALVRGLNLPENVYLSARFEAGYASGQSG